MRIARILYPVEVLGPGKRVGIWVTGCPHHCEFCCNKELWDERAGSNIPNYAIYKAIASIKQQGEIDGFVITGGDPMLQAKELAGLLPLLSRISEDILVYTGFNYEDLRQQNDEMINKCMQYIGVIIDGKYIDELNNGSKLRGSSNQNIIILKETLQQTYEQYISDLDGNEMQIFPSKDGVIAVGIPQRNFRNELVIGAKKRGVMIDDR